MKIISMNIRGVEGKNKKKYLCELILKEQVDVVCLQETKSKELRMEGIYKMWGTNEVEWVENGNVNNARGVITMWRENCFMFCKVFNGHNYSIIEG